MDRNPTDLPSRRDPGFALAALFALALAPACASPSADPTLTVEVAALDLADVADVCWDLRITNGPAGTGDLVLARGNQTLASPADTTTLCASRYGQRGALTFVAPCDSSLQRPSSVTVWLDSLWEVGADTPSTTYRDPCENGCTLDVTCRENADSRATFDITVMRDARQGFFDMAVTFGDIFCAAKLDTCDSQARPNLLLFGADGERLPTAVLALSCIGGPDATAPTHLHAGAVIVTCQGQNPTLLDLASVAQLGNQPPIDGLRWAVYAGSGPPPGGGAATLDYLNVAIATDSPGCAVSWQATASEGPTLPGDADLPGLYVYPVIETDEVAITGSTGAWLCARHPLDGPDSRVTTAYRQRTTRSAPTELVAPNGSSWSSGKRVIAPPPDPEDPGGPGSPPDTGPADTTAPWVTALSTPSGGNYVQGQALQFTLTFSEPVLTAALRLPVTVGDKDLTLVPLGVTPSVASVVTFRYTVGPDDLAQGGIAVGPALLSAYTDVAGNPGDPTIPSSGEFPAIRVNDMPLALLSITPPPNGWYLEGSLLTFTVTYNRAVAVDDSAGSPTIDFTLGSGTGTARSATYLDGAELGVLRFVYEVIDGENDPDGLAMSVAQIVLNGATLTDTVPVDEDQTPINAPRTFTLPNLSGIRIDTVSPTLTTLTKPANTTYTLGQTLRTTLTFSEPITVSGGSPTIELIIGSRVVQAQLATGNGTSTLHFDYVVQSGDFSDSEDGGVELSQLKLNGATLADLAGHGPNLDAFIPTTWSLVYVDAVAAPTILSVTGPPNGNYRVGESLLFTVTFSEPVVITPYIPTANAPPTRPALQLTIGSTTRYATWLDEGPSATHVFEYVIQSGDSDTNGIALVSPLAIQSASYPIRSEEWNKDAIRTFTPPNLSQVLVENVANTDAITVTNLTVPTAKYYRNTRIMSFTAYFNRSLTLSATNGTRPRIAIRIGDKIRYAESYYLSGTRSSLLMRYTVVEEDEDHDGIELLSSAIELNGGSLTASGNPPIDLSLPARDTTGIKVDGLLATIVSITPPEDRYYLLNEVISFSVTFSEPVYVTYTPKLRLNIRTGASSTIRSARYAAGSGTNVLRFDYKVGTSDEDQDGIALSVTGTPTSPITLGNSVRIRDMGGNNADRLYTTNDFYPNLRVDGIVPKVTSVARSPSTTVYLQPGASADFLVNFGENTVVSGTPRLRIVVGTTTRYALYRPDLSTPTQLVFRYTIQPGERDSNGITIYSPLELDGGSMSDVPGNPANLNLYSIASMTGLRVGCSDVATKNRYGYTSLRTYTNTKPGGCSKLVFKLWGAGGGASYTSEGGGGGFAMATFDATNIASFTVVLGIRGSSTSSSTSTTRPAGYSGFNGGFTRSHGGQGAGASAVLVDNVPLAIVGGGGGGGAGGLTSNNNTNPAPGGASNIDGGQSGNYAAGCLDVSARGRAGTSSGLGGVGGCAPGGLACGTNGNGGAGGDAGFGGTSYTGGGGGGGGAAGGGGGAGLCGNGGAGGLTVVASDPRMTGVVVQGGNGRNPGGTTEPEYSSSYGRGGIPSSRAGQYSRLVYYWQ